MGSTAKWSGLRKEPCELEDRTTEMIDHNNFSQ